MRNAPSVLHRLSRHLDHLHLDSSPGREGGEGSRQFWKLRQCEFSAAVVLDGVLSMETGRFSLKRKIKSLIPSQMTIRGMASANTSGV